MLNLSPVVSESGGAPSVLVVATSNRRRGAEVFSERLRTGLIERGWVVDAVSLSDDPYVTTAGLEPLTGIDPSGLGRLNLGALLALRNRVRHTHPDVVLANGGATLRYGVAATLGSASRLAYVGIGEPRYWLRSSLSEMLNRFLLRRTDAILAVSAMTRAQLLEIEPSLQGSVHLAPTGVPERFFDLDHVMAEGPLRVLVLGSLSAEKDPTTALRAVMAIPGARLRFVGDGPMRGELKVAAGNLGHTDRVEFVGSVGDVTPHLEWAHVLALTSLTEGLPGVILEAGASGVPSVAVDVGGVSEAVSDGETGYVVPHDEGAVSDALLRLDADRALLAAMGRAARHHVRARFALAQAVDRYVEVLEGLLA